MDQRIKEKIFGLFDMLQKESIQVHYAPMDKMNHPVQSQFGGKPHLPEDFQWPYYEGESYDYVVANRPLSFLAEIDLSELPGGEAKNLLPKEGVLSFFYEMASMKWGYDPKDKGCARVFYFKDKSQLCTRDFPENLEEDYQFPELKLTFEKKRSLPSYEDFFQLMAEKNLFQEDVLWEGELDYFDFDSLREAYGCTMEEFGENSKILGYPDVLQNPMELECELVTQGYYLGDESVSLAKELEEKIEQQSKEWLLLFQMGTVEHEDFQLMFGDCGHIYFWIKQEDLLNRNYDGIWQILQCG